MKTVKLTGTAQDGETLAYETFENVRLWSLNDQWLHMYLGDPEEQQYIDRKLITRIRIS